MSATDPHEDYGYIPPSAVWMAELEPEILFLPIHPNWYDCSIRGLDDRACETMIGTWVPRW